MPGIPEAQVAQALPQPQPAPQAPPMQPVAPFMQHPDARTRRVLMHIGTLQLPFKVIQQAYGASALP